MTDEHDPATSAAAARDPSIRSRVITLVAIVIAPFIAIMMWLATDYASVQRDVIEIEREGVSERLAHLVDREIAAIQGTLQGFSGSDAMANGDFARVKAHAEHVATQNNFSAIRIFDPSGAIVFSTTGNLHDEIPAKVRADIINMVFRGATAVSDLHGGSGTAPLSLFVTVPIAKNGHIPYAVSAAIKPDRLAPVFNEGGLKPDWIAAVVDKTGRFIARSLNPQHFVGQLARPELVTVAANSSERGEFKNVTHEGTRTENSYRKSKLTGWTQAVAVPKDILEAPYRRSMALILSGTAAVSLLSLALAAMMAARISEPIRRLRNIAADLIEGRSPPETPLNIAELNEVRDALHEAVEKREHLAAIVTSSGDAIFSVGLDGRVRSWNHGAESLFGYTADEMIGRSKTVVVPPDRQGETAKHISVISTGENMRAETVRITRDGRHIDVELDMAPIRGSSGAIIAMSSILHDITSRKAAEKHQRFLIRELTHRSKNLLAIVQSMARQTARSATSIQDFETRYMHRLQGLAASHDLLVNQDWAGAPLDELIIRQMAAFSEGNRMNVAISGPAITISAKAAQTIGLALHELATNSMKYGALSTPAGKVSIEWVYLLAGDKPERLELKWQEHDGPPVTPPRRMGFGHFVIDRMATQSLNAQVLVDFRPEGLIWVLTVAVASLENEPEFAGGDTFG